MNSNPANSIFLLTIESKWSILLYMEQISDYKYKLKVKAGAYYANSLPKLIFEMLKHRFWHFKRGDGWID